jgi:glycopeptide antibiotics resistance protein
MIETFFNIRGTLPWGMSEAASGKILLPITIAVLVVALALCVRRRTSPGRTLVILLFIAYISCVAEITMFPIPKVPVPPGAGEPVLNLVPLKGTLELFRNSVDVAIRNAGGNALLLMPLGAFIPYLSRARAAQGALCLFAATLSIEAIQYVGSFIILHANWRIVDIDDFIFNFAGSLVGLAIYSLIARRGGKNRRRAKRHIRRR